MELFKISRSMKKWGQKGKTHKRIRAYSRRATKSLRGGGGLTPGNTKKNVFFIKGEIWEKILGNRDQG